MVDVIGDGVASAAGRQYEECERISAS